MTDQAAAAQTNRRHRSASVSRLGRTNEKTLVCDFMRQTNETETCSQPTSIDATSPAKDRRLTPPPDSMKSRKTSSRTRTVAPPIPQMLSSSSSLSSYQAPQRSPSSLLSPMSTPEHSPATACDSRFEAFVARLSPEPVSPSPRRTRVRSNSEASIKSQRRAKPALQELDPNSSQPRSKSGSSDRLATRTAAMPSPSPSLQSKQASVASSFTSLPALNVGQSFEITALEVSPQPSSEPLRPPRPPRSMRRVSSQLPLDSGEERSPVASPVLSQLDKASRFASSPTISPYTY